MKADIMGNNARMQDYGGIFFQDLVEKLPAAIAICDREMRYMAYSERWIKDNRIGRDNLIGCCHYDIIPEVSDLWKEEHKKCFAGETIKKVEERFHRSDNSTDWLRRELIPLRNRYDEIDAIMIIAEYVTQRKHAEIILSGCAREMASISESCPAMMNSIHLKPDNCVCMPYVSANVHEFLGLCPEDVADDAAPFLDRIHPLDLPRVRDSLMASARDLRPCLEEFRILHPSRGRLWMKIYGNPEPHPSGGMIWYGYIFDITGKKLAEEKLIESERRFRELAELLPETIFEADLKGRLTFVNQKAHDLFGYSHDDFEAGVNAFEIISEKDRGRAKANLERVFQGKSITDNEYEMQKKDGGVFPGQIHASVITRDNQVAGFRGIVIDMTEKKRTREILIQSEKMMSLGGLAAGIAHEINNPLSGMVQNVQVILNRLSQDLPANIQAARDSGTTMESIKAYMDKRKIFHLMDHIRVSGFQASKIIQNMLNFSRPAPLRSQPCDLSAVIENTLEFAGQDHDFKPVRIIKEFEPGLPRVPCDENQIQQVILNIIKNSMDAALEIKGTLKGLVLCFRLTRGKNKVCMEIEDNGPGMEESVRKRAFEPFFTTKGKGTGLGLSVSYFIIVNNHKGEMEVSSVLGQGTKFTIRLACQPGS